MNIYLKSIIAISVILVVFISGAIFGYRKGVDGYAFAREPINVAIKLQMLELIEEGKMDTVRNLYEHDADTAIYSYMAYENQPYLDRYLQELLIPEMVSNNEKAVDILAKRRKTIPMAINCEFIDRSSAGKDEKAEVRRNCKDMVSAISQFIEKRTKSEK